MSETQQQDLPTVKRKIPIPFFTNVGAATGVGLSTDIITFPFVVTHVQAHFPDDALSNLQVWVFVSSNRNVTTATPMPDNKVLGYYSPTPYLVGSGEIVDVDVHVTPAENEQYVKVYFFNTNAYAVDGYCIVTIETPYTEAGSIIPSLELKDETRYTFEEWMAIFDKQAHAAHDLTLDNLSGSRAWLKVDSLRHLKGEGETSESWREQAMKTATMTRYFTPDMHIDDFYAKLIEWFNDAQGVMNLYSTANIIGEVSGLGFINFTDDLVNRDEETWKIGSQMGTVNQITYDASMNKYAKYSANWYFQAEIPDVNNLINMVVKEKITLDYFKEQMRKQGYTEAWSQRIWDAHFIAPDFETVKRAYWREGISQENLVEFLKLVDLDPRYNDEVWLKLIEEIPPYPDLINMRVKEVITQTTFKNALRYQGFFGEWANRLWDAHFTPASFTDFLTAMRRKETVNIPVAEGSPVPYTFGVDASKDIQKIKELSILADYDPRYWDFFNTRIYNDPSYRMIMWGYEAGAISPEDVPEMVHRLGLLPKDEEWYTKFLMTFQERPWITRYLTALQTAYIQGAITDADLRLRVSQIPRNENIANWMIKTAEVRKEITAKGTKPEQQQLITAGELKKAYVYGQISEDDFRTRLLQRGYMLLDVDLIISIINHEQEIADFGGRKEGLTTTEYFDAWRYGEMTENDLRTALMTKGLNLQEINILINTKKRKWQIGGVESEVA